MLSEWSVSIWLRVFRSEGVCDQIAREEYQTWAESLDGELDNEFLQTDFSVMSAAEEAVKELQAYEKE